MRNIESVGIGLVCFLTQRSAEGHAKGRRVFGTKFPKIYDRFVNLLHGLVLSRGDNAVQNTLARFGL